MDIKLARTLVGIIDDSELHEEYSGRSMYGEITAGVVVNDLADVMSAIINGAEAFIDGYDGDVYPAFSNVNLKIDNMGKIYILY